LTIKNVGKAVKYYRNFISKSKMSKLIAHEL